MHNLEFKVEMCPICGTIKHPNHEKGWCVIAKSGPTTTHPSAIYSRKKGKEND